MEAVLLNMMWNSEIMAPNEKYKTALQRLFILSSFKSLKWTWFAFTSNKQTLLPRFHLKRAKRCIFFLAEPLQPGDNENSEADKEATQTTPLNDLT